jgi:hypothetical protein
MELCFENFIEKTKEMSQQFFIPFYAINTFLFFNHALFLKIC